jgi:hypothetical protein
MGIRNKNPMEVNNTEKNKKDRILALNIRRILLKESVQEFMNFPQRHILSYQATSSLSFSTLAAFVILDPYLKFSPSADSFRSMRCLFSLATSPTPVSHSPGPISYHQTCSQMKCWKNNSLFPRLTSFLPYFVWFPLGRARGFKISSLYTNVPIYAQINFS